MTEQDVVKYWREGADDALVTAQALMDAKRYHHALFFCHLAIEKMLKAIIVVVSHEPPIPIHDLLRLAETAKLVMTDEQRDSLREVDKFNIAARYENYKQAFYKKATAPFALRWFACTKELLLWLKEH
ncbi:HEPN domain-containing protein [Candidatus Gottesmanbacteria bacterium]|nr:HEPN domain-containing protein [Candidatus Gottesmanbacteria bacterium]